MDEGEILALVLATIGTEADDLGYDHLRHPHADTPLYGGESGIDSLSLVRVIVAVEAATRQRFGRQVTLADERAMSLRNSPFRTAGTLAALLATRLGTPHA